MAGRPVPSRVGGGLSGLHYGLISFVFISVIALVGFVLQLTKVKDLVAANARLQRDIDDYGVPPAHYVDLQRYYEDEAGSRRNQVFTVMAGDIADLSQRITGRTLDDNNPLYPTLVAEMATRQFNRNIMEERQALIRAGVPDPKPPFQEGDALLTIIDKLSRSSRKLKVDNLKLNERLGEMQSTNETLSSEVSRVQKEFQDEIEAQKDRNDQRALEQGKIMALKDQQLGDLQTKLDERTQQLNQLRQRVQQQDREKDLQVEQLKGQVAMLQDQIRALRPATFDPEAILRKADGRILRAIPGSEIVYISVGASQGLKVGMGFEVYSQTRETPRSIRGKASLEVVTVMSDTAECRVTRLVRGSPIIEGDIIVNIAYERNRKPKFVVRGEFDLDYDRNVDFDGAEKIAAMIREWGGQVVDQLDETTDFLVIGAAPYAPTFAEGEIISPQVAEQVRTQQLAGSRFQAEIQRAQATYIPVITQSQFLFLTGNTGY